MDRSQQKLVNDGYCDQRGAGFCANANVLPKGEYGIVLLCVKGNILSIYDIDMRNNVGDELYHIPLHEIQNLKYRTGFFFQVLKFDYSGYTYQFSNFLGAKSALKVLEEESKK